MCVYFKLEECIILSNFHDLAIDFPCQIFPYLNDKCLKIISILHVCNVNYSLNIAIHAAQKIVKSTLRSVTVKLE